MTPEHGAEDWELQSVRFVPESAAAPPPRAGVCHTHADRAGLFRCAGCARLFCDECAPEKLMSGELVRFCRLCGGVCADVEEETATEAAPVDQPRPAPLVSSAHARIRTAPLPPPAPEPAPNDRQLVSILIHPFKGYGVLWLLIWWVSIFMAWPVPLLLFVPYLWASYLGVERGRSRISGPWRLGGGPWNIGGRWMKLLISPGLPIALCYTLLSGGNSYSGAGPVGDPGTGSGVLRIAGMILLAAMAFLLPLMMVVLFRTGSPFKTLDPVTLVSIIRRSPSRYVACLVSLIVLAGFALTTYLLLAMIPFPTDLPGLGLAKRPGPAQALAGVLGIVWIVISLGRYGHWLSWCLEEEDEEGT